MGYWDCEQRTGGAGLPEGDAAGAGAASRCAGLVRWDRHIPEGLDVLCPCVSSGMPLSPLLASLCYS